MTHRISRRDLAESLRDHPISTPALQRQPQTAGVGLEAADRDGDGLIEGEREVGDLHRLLGRHRRGTRRQLTRGVALAAGSTELERRVGDIDLRDTVVVVGMSDTSVREAEMLRHQTGVQLIGDIGPGDRRDVVSVRGATVDLAHARGRAAFLLTLDLPAAQRAAVRKVLESVKPGARREIAELARTWAPAERGRAIPERLMLSGHGDGNTIFGNDHDEIRREDVLALARVLPQAAGQIRALHLAACQHGYESRMEEFIDVFPNIQSVWGYAGFSPSGRPAWTHQQRWERATRARSRRPPTPALAAGTRRAVSVAVWVRGRGWSGPPVRPMGDINDDVNDAGAMFREYLSGAREVTNPGTGPLADHYQLLQELTRHHDFADQQIPFRTLRTRERDQSLRLRFFNSHVAPNFARRYGAEIRRGYAALNLSVPNIAEMNRGEAMAAIAAFDAAAGRASPLPSAARRLRHLLTAGLNELSTDLIPTSWL